MLSLTFPSLRCPDSSKRLLRSMSKSFGKNGTLVRLFAALATYSDAEDRRRNKGDHVSQLKSFAKTQLAGAVIAVDHVGSGVHDVSVQKANCKCTNRLRDRGNVARAKR